MCFTWKINFNVTLLKPVRNQAETRNLVQSKPRKKSNALEVFGGNATRDPVDGPMKRFLTRLVVGLVAVGLLASIPAPNAANQARGTDPEEFGPVVRAYLGYLRNEQEVVDDRVSRHEVNQAYYRRNSNRIRALRQMAIRIARESRNDYLPELEAVARDELGLLLERPPRPETLREGEILRATFRYLGVIRSVENFYVFARLDPYEQAELMEKSPPLTVGQKPSRTGLMRPRRATSP